MKIIFGKAGTGKANELLKMFIDDKKEAIFVSSEGTPEEIKNKIVLLQGGEIDFEKMKNKTITTNRYLECNSDYYLLVRDNLCPSLYLDIKVPKDFTMRFKNYCMDLEKDYGANIIITEQLPDNSIIKGIDILNIKNVIE